MSHSRVKKNDQVKVISGSERGKSGKVLKVFPGKDRAIVEGIKFIKKHVKPNPKLNVKGGIVEREAPIELSNLQVVCPECSKPSRLGIKLLEDGTRVRFCKACKGVVDR